MKNLLIRIGKKSRKAFADQINTKKKNKVLKDFSKLIRQNKNKIIHENKKDIENSIKFAIYSKNDFEIKSIYEFCKKYYQEKELLKIKSKKTIIDEEIPTSIKKIEIDYDIFLAGLIDGMETEMVRFDQKQRREIMASLQKNIRDKAKLEGDTNLKIADEFLEKIVEQAKGIIIGDPLKEETQMGPLCTVEQLEHIEKQITKAQKEGAKLLCGGHRLEKSSGLYYEPTIVSCPRQDLEIVDTELFGPVLAVIRFKTEEEVIRLANDTSYGLAAGIFTRDSARSLRMSKSIRAGIIWVNTYRVVSPIAEFGGFKQSGFGRESGFQAIYDYTRPKTVWMNMSDEIMSNPFVMR